MRGRSILVVLLLAGAFFAGWAAAQDGKLTKAEREAKKGEMKEKLKTVRREVKQLDLLETIAKVPALVGREREYRGLLEKLAMGPADPKPLLEQARVSKMAALADLNVILKKHAGKHAGLAESDVRTRLQNARFEGVHYQDEWLVNILDDIEESAEVNIELDARVYKFDTVTFDFEHTSAMAMLQTMADNLEFAWIIRGDTLYVYKERFEVLFNDEWLAKKKAAWKARQKEQAAAANARDAKAGEK